MIEESYLLEVIKDRIAANRSHIERYGESTDYMEGAIMALQELAVQFDLAAYKDFLK